jgi:uncharacterized protein
VLYGLSQTHAFAEESVTARMEQAQDAFFQGNLDLAYTEFQALRETGLPLASYYLALIHRREGKYQDFTRAISLLQQASLENYPPALREVGMAYDRGEGVTEDLLTAMDWYRKADALEKDNTTSVQFFVSQNGSLIEQDIHQQIQRLEQAASQGDTNAPNQLAKLYDRGALVPQDIQKAVHWYRIAAEHGDADSRFMLGYFLCRGIGLPKNTTEANHWLNLSDRKAHCDN